MQYDTYGVMQMLAAEIRLDQDSGYPLAFILSRYIYGTESRWKGCGLGANNKGRSGNSSEKSEECFLFSLGFSAHPAGLQTRDVFNR